MAGKDLLLIFTRNPVEGQVKKRLAAGIGSKLALNVYQDLLEHTRDFTRGLGCTKWVFYSEEIPSADCFDPEHFSKKLQEGKNLGERMYRAFKTGFKAGFEKIIIIGSDLYDLEQKDLERAFETLDSCDVVLGPAVDGGYYLLGMKSLFPKVFLSKSWGSETVLNETLADLENEAVTLLGERNDIDHLEDLTRYPQIMKKLQINDKINT